MLEHKHENSQCICESSLILPFAYAVMCSSTFVSSSLTYLYQVKPYAHN